MIINFIRFSRIPFIAAGEKVTQFTLLYHFIVLCWGNTKFQGKLLQLFMQKIDILGGAYDGKRCRPWKIKFI